MREIVDMEILSSQVTDEDLSGGIKDEYGAIYSNDGTRLLKFTSKRIREYTIKEGTRVCCDKCFRRRINLESVTLPNSIVKIGSFAFAWCEEMTSIQIPEGVISIDNLAFSDSGLKRVDLPNSLTSIGKEVFSGCRNLKEINLSDKVTSIGPRCFKDCSNLSVIRLSDSITKIEKETLAYCVALKEIKIPNAVKSIGLDAFRGCSALEKISIGENIPIVRGYSFSGCYKLTTFKVAENNKHLCSIDGVIYSKDMTRLECVPSGFVGTFNIPISVSVIAPYAFHSCRELLGVNLPNVTTIGSHAFSSCINLKEINLSKGVTSIEENAFDGCTSLTKVTIGKGVKKIGNYAFSGCFQLTKIDIPNNVRKICQGAFQSCINLSKIRIGKGVTSISTSVFEQCNLLTKISVDKGNKYFSTKGSALFSKDMTKLIRCFLSSSVASYKIPEGVITICDNAFQGKRNLSKVTIPKSVDEIKSRAFCECRRLKTIVSYNPIPPNMSLTPAPVEVFSGVNVWSCTIYVPKGSKDAYSRVEGWKDFKNIVEME